jgi:hypothetical protein
MCDGPHCQSWLDLSLVALDNFVALLSYLLRQSISHSLDYVLYGTMDQEARSVACSSQPYTVLSLSAMESIEI